MYSNWKLGDSANDQATFKLRAAAGSPAAKPRDVRQPHRRLRIRRREGRSATVAKALLLVYASELASARAILAGFRDAEMVGICGVAPPGRCHATLPEKVRILPAVIIGNQARTIVRVVRWSGHWSRRDLVEPHWHLGLLAVEPALQGLGIGALMNRFSAQMDRRLARSYLKTDKSEHVDFYRQFGLPS